MNDHPRLISLAPTQTEIVAALDMVQNLTGVTEDCDFPEAVKRIRTFGSWYSPDIKAIVNAKPDLVLTFGSHQEEIQAALEDAGIRVYHSEPTTIDASLNSFREIAALIGKTEECERLVASLNTRLQHIRKALATDSPRPKPSILRIMNWDPLISLGPGAFQHDVIEFAGGINCMGDGPSSYFVCDPKEIQARNPDIIFFCEPQIKDFLERDPDWQKVSAVKHHRIFIYDCGLTCRSGPRIVEMAEELNKAVLSVR